MPIGRDASVGTFQLALVIDLKENWKGGTKKKNEKDEELG